MDSSRADAPQTDLEELWREKREKLDSLVKAYETLLALTQSTDLDRLGPTLRRTEELTRSIRRIDEQLEATSRPKNPPDPGGDLDRLLEKLRGLNGRITEEIEKQQKRVRDELSEVRALRRAVREYRPFRKPTGRRLDWSG